jgi:hypothetical protein
MIAMSLDSRDPPRSGHALPMLSELHDTTAQVQAELSATTLIAEEATANPPPAGPLQHAK